MMSPPHQVGTLEGILIGDFDTPRPKSLKREKIRAAVWILDNGPGLAAALDTARFSTHVRYTRIVGFIDDPYAEPSIFPPQVDED